MEWPCAVGQFLWLRPFAMHRVCVPHQRVCSANTSSNHCYALVFANDDTHGSSNHTADSNFH